MQVVLILSSTHLSTEAVTYELNGTQRLVFFCLKTTVTDLEKNKIALLDYLGYDWMGRCVVIKCRIIYCEFTSLWV